VRRSDFWTYDAPRLTAGGSDSHTYRVRVHRGVTALKVSLSHPSLGSLVANLSSYTVTVRDPRGKVVGTTHESATAGSGTATAFLRLRRTGAGPGTYRLNVSGQYAASDPDTLDSDSLLGRMVTLQVAQLRRG
jgi:serine protease AprX